MRHTPYMLLGAAALLLGAGALLQTQIQAERDDVRDSLVKHMGSKNEMVRRQATHLFHAMYLPEADAMRWLSVGNRNVASDFILYKSLRYVSLEFAQGGEKMEFLEKMYNVMLDLDPDWKNVYILAGWMLSSVNRKPDAALRILDRGAERWPDSFRFPYEAGMICLLNSSLRDRACKYFQVASTKSDCPVDIAEVAPIICEEVGDLRTAVTLAVRQYEQRRAVSDPESPLVLGSLRLVLDLQTDFLLQRLRQAIDAYLSRQRKPPAHLGALFGTQQQPKDAFGYPLIYDPVSGRVHSRGRLILKLNRLAGFVTQLVVTYKQKQSGRVPHALDGPPHPDGRRSLLEEVRAEMAPRMNNLPEQLVLHLGPKLKLPRFPTGFELLYDATTGEVSVPPELSLAGLDKRVLEVSRRLSE